ncbi:MAG: hypothetical protein OXG83_14320 [Acidobacteria bacterium]|nr:hypothetical protein [Acidobacteriota bacterium]
MNDKALRFILVCFIVLGVASTATAMEATAVANPQGHLPTEVDTLGDELLLATVGGEVSMMCLGAVAGATVAGLVVGAATGGAGLALLGAYAPLAVVLCV